MVFLSSCCQTCRPPPENRLHAFRRLPELNLLIPGRYMDYTLAYIGAGFITPLAVNVSIMIGAVLSWGIAWPLIANREGDWYEAGLTSHSCTISSMVFLCADWRSNDLSTSRASSFQLTSSPAAMTLLPPACRRPRLLLHRPLHW